MTGPTMNPYFRDYLIKEAQLMTTPEKDSECEDGKDFDPREWSGGNFYFCYEMGVNDGMILYARKVCEMHGIEWRKS